MADFAISRADVEEARTRIEPYVRRTDLRHLRSLGLAVKLETEQITGSFKVRGATNIVRAFRPSGVVTGSSGNHGSALAYAAREAGVPHAVVVMPTDASAFKRARAIEFGAEVVPSEGGNTARDELAKELARERGWAFVPSYDHPLVMAGQGTLGLEVGEDAPELETALLPVGGGGLISEWRPLCMTARRECGSSAWSRRLQTTPFNRSEPDTELRSTRPTRFATEY